MSSVDWGGASGRANKTWGAERDRARERERENKLRRQWATETESE